MSENENGAQFKNQKVVFQEKAENSTAQFLTTLTWENINVYAPYKKPSIFASAKKVEEFIAAGPKHIVQNGKTIKY